MSVTGRNFKANLATLTPKPYDEVFNIDSALSCGSGVAVSDGTTWKNVYTGATY